MTTWLDLLQSRTMASGCKRRGWTYCSHGQWYLDADDNLAGLIVVKDNGIWMQMTTQLDLQQTKTMVSGCRQLNWTYCRQGQWHLGADDNLAGLVVVKDNGIWMQTTTWLDLLQSRTMASVCRRHGWTYCSQGQWHLDADDNLAGLIVDKDNGVWVQTTCLDLLQSRTMASGCRRQLSWTYCSQGQWHLDADNNLPGLIVVKHNGIWVQTTWLDLLQPRTMVSGCGRHGWTYCSQGQWHLDAEDNLAGLIVDKDNGIWVQTITWLDLLQ